MTYISLRQLRFGFKIALLGLAALLPLAAQAYSVGPAVRISTAGHTVGEVSIETSPTNPNVMVANTIDNDLPGNTLIDQIRCAMYRSQDAGATWAEVPAWPRTPELQPLHDPWVATGADGTIHATCIANVLGVGQVAYVKSVDDGLTWSAPTIVTPLTTLAGADKSVIQVGVDGRLLVCYRQAGNLVLSQSTDLGNSWTTAAVGIDAHCNGITTAPGGYITLATMHGPALDNYGTITSNDNGATWGSVVTLGVAQTFLKLQFPSMVRDYTGRTVIAGVNGVPGKKLVISTENDAGALLSQWEVTTPTSHACSNQGRFIHPQLVAAPGQLPALQITCKITPTKNMGGEQETWFYPVIDGPNNSSAPVLVSSISLPAIPVAPAPGTLADRFPDGGFFWDITWKSGGWLSAWIDPTTGPGIGELMAAPVLP